MGSAATAASRSTCPWCCSEPRPATATPTPGGRWPPARSKWWTCRAITSRSSPLRTSPFSARNWPPPQPVSQGVRRVGAVSVADRATELLRQLAGPDATFRDGQLEAIEALVERRQRVLVVQRTGWGKSAVYFVATRLLREAGAGPTLLISPLLALMRNQIDAATRLGVHAVTINSTN